MATEIEALYKLHDGKYVVELVLNEVRQLFNSLDPSPFREKELDRNAEEYIFNAVGDIPVSKPVELIIYLPASRITPEISEAIKSGIHYHFQYLSASEETELRRLNRRGRRFLLLGVVILFGGVVTSQVINLYSQNLLARALQSILLIISWVTIWEPIHIFLYDRSPINQKIQIYDKISRMDIFVGPIKVAQQG